jgi:hypothetical protein
METMTREAAIEMLTGVSVNLDDLKGRNVWGRVAFNRSGMAGMIHVEVMPKDKPVNDAAMPTITEADMAVGGDERYRLYRRRCNEIARDRNEATVKEHRLILLVASNGQLTREAKILIDAIL